MKSALGELEGEKQLLLTKWDWGKGSSTAGSWWKRETSGGMNLTAGGNYAQWAQDAP